MAPQDLGSVDRGDRSSSTTAAGRSPRPTGGSGAEAERSGLDEAELPAHPRAGARGAEPAPASLGVRSDADRVYAAEGNGRWYRASGRSWVCGRSRTGGWAPRPPKAALVTLCYKGSGLRARPLRSPGAPARGCARSGRRRGRGRGGSGSRRGRRRDRRPRRRPPGPAAGPGPTRARSTPGVMGDDDRRLRVDDRDDRRAGRGARRPRAGARRPAAPEPRTAASGSRATRLSSSRSTTATPSAVRTCAITPRGRRAGRRRAPRRVARQRSALRRRYGRRGRRSRRRRPAPVGSRRGDGMGADQLGDTVGEDDAAARAERDHHLADAQPAERSLVVAVDEQLGLLRRELEDRHRRGVPPGRSRHRARAGRSAAGRARPWPSSERRRPRASAASVSAGKSARLSGRDVHPARVARRPATASAGVHGSAIASIVIAPPLVLVREGEGSRHGRVLPDDRDAEADQRREQQLPVRGRALGDDHGRRAERPQRAGGVERSTADPRRRRRRPSRARASRPPRRSSRPDRDAAERDEQDDRGDDADRLQPDAAVQRAWRRLRARPARDDARQRDQPRASPPAAGRARAPACPPAARGRANASSATTRNAAPYSGARTSIVSPRTTKRPAYSAPSSASPGAISAGIRSRSSRRRGRRRRTRRSIAEQRPPSAAPTAAA